jgi:hypothetical protein
MHAGVYGLWLNTMLDGFVGMSDGSTTLAKKTRPRVIRRILLALGLVFILYVLLEGLAYRLWMKDVISHKTYASIYAPIFYLDHRCTWLSNLDDDYENLWYNQGKALMDSVDSDLSKEGIISTVVNSPPTFFTFQDLFNLGLAALVAGMGASLIYFPQWVYRVVRQEQIARDRKRDRIWGFIILTMGIILFLFQFRELLIFGL